MSGPESPSSGSDRSARPTRSSGGLEDLSAGALEQRIRESYQRRQRLSAHSLRGGAERPVDAIFDQVESVVGSHAFQMACRRILSRALREREQGRGGGSWLSPQVLSPGFLSSLQDTVIKVLADARRALRREEHEGLLQREDLHLEAVFSRRLIARQPLGRFLERELGLTTHQRALALGQFIPAVQEAVGLAVVVAGESRYNRLPGAPLALISEIHPSFAHSPRESWLLANRYRHDSAELMRTFLDRIDRLPRPLLVGVTRVEGRILFDRLRLSLAQRQWDDGEALGERQLRVLEIISRLCANRDIELYLNRAGGEVRILHRLMNAVRRNEGILCTVSCPDYSGRAVNTPQGPQWKFDFRDLGSDIGIIGRKSVRWLQAWVEAMQPCVKEVRVEHYAPTFEVMGGFRSRDGRLYLSAREAVRRVQASGDKLAGALAALGVSATARLSREVLPDRRMSRERGKLALQLTGDVEREADLGQLVRSIYDSRRELYRTWHPPRRSEDSEAYAGRLQRRVIPLQVAEYILLGRALTQAPNSLLLTSDSPVMNEVLSRFGVPAQYGHDARALDYRGAR